MDCVLATSVIKAVFGEGKVGTSNCLGPLDFFPLTKYLIQTRPGNSWICSWDYVHVIEVWGFEGKFLPSTSNQIQHTQFCRMTFQKKFRKLFSRTKALFFYQKIFLRILRYSLIFFKKKCVLFWEKLSENKFRKLSTKQVFYRNISEN